MVFAVVFTACEKKEIVESIDVSIVEGEMGIHSDVYYMFSGPSWNAGEMTDAGDVINYQIVNTGDVAYNLKDLKIEITQFKNAEVAELILDEDYVYYKNDVVLQPGDTQIIGVARIFILSTLIGTDWFEITFKVISVSQNREKIYIF